jgi:hypothetical protein
MNRISIKLKGGICNNLFQIVCAYTYSLKYNKELVLANEKFGTVHGSLESYKDNILHKINFEEKIDYNKFNIYYASAN